MNPIQDTNVQARKSYRSVFDRIVEMDGSEHVFGDHVELQKFRGPFQGLLEELEVLSSKPKLEMKDLFETAFYPAHVIRAAVNHKIKNPSESSEKLVRDAVQLGLRVYRNHSGYSAQVRDFADKVKSMAPSLCSSELDYNSDSDKPVLCFVKAAILKPERSRNSAGTLSEKMGSRDVLFVALANSGIAPGMDVYLRYCDSAGSDSSSFYVVRFSRWKSKDKTPKVTAREVNYLRTQAEQRQLVIFDDDTYTGRTMEIAKKYFSKRLTRGSEPITLFNLKLDRGMFIHYPSKGRN